MITQKNMKKSLLLILVLSFSATVVAQVSHGGKPTMDAFRLSAVRHYEAPSIDKTFYLQQDVDMIEGSSPLRMGITRDVDIEVLFTEGSYRIVSNELQQQVAVGVLKVSSPGATFQSLWFSRFDLPVGARLFIYDEQGSHVFGSFTQQNRQPDGTFYTQPIPGSVCFVEYQIPLNQVETYRSSALFRIGRINQGYKDIYADNLSAKDHIGYSKGHCHIDVACEMGDPWRDQIRSVVEIYTLTTSGGYLCSGALVNNTANDKAPYVLSAYHCQDVHDSIIGHTFFFNYQASSCGADDAPIDQTVIGGTTLAKWGESDFWLVRLNEPIPDAYQPYYAGWSRAVVDKPGIGCGIHHPGGDIKKISFPYRIQLTAGNYSRFYRVDWTPTKGVVEQGSSGSPIFNSDGLVIGQLWAAFGPVSCEDASGYSMYGRIASSWSGNGQASGSLCHWLDPLYKGVSTCKGMDYTTPAHLPAEVSADESLFLFPNPSNGMVKVSVPAIGEATYLLRDTQGNIVLQGRTILSTTTHMLNLTGLPSGAYYIELTIDGHTYKNSVIIFH